MGLAIGTEEGGGNMRLKPLTHVRLIEVGAPWKTKEDVIRHLIDRLHQEGKISSAATSNAGEASWSTRSVAQSA